MGQVLNLNANLDVEYDSGKLEVLDLLANWDPHASANSYLHANMDLGASARVQRLDPLAKTATMGAVVFLSLGLCFGIFLLRCHPSFRLFLCRLLFHHHGNLMEDFCSKYLEVKQVPCREVLYLFLCCLRLFHFGVPMANQDPFLQLQF